MRLFTALTLLCLSAGTSRAQSAPTCVYLAANDTVRLTVDGQLATLAVADAGAIQMNGVNCGDATTSNTDTVIIDQIEPWTSDQVVVQGDFAPGATLETGVSEIEFLIDEPPSPGADPGPLRLTFELTNTAESVIFTPGGIDMAGDGDEDVILDFNGRAMIRAAGGNDTIDASAFTQLWVQLYLYGGPGSDVIIGSDRVANRKVLERLYGDHGNDEIDGRGGIDNIYGGPGNDLVEGGAGDDVLHANSTVDGDDIVVGGDGRDVLSYARRTIGVNVTLGPGPADDGQPGVERDQTSEIEVVVGGSGADVLVGGPGEEYLDGAIGDDEIFGGDGDDDLHGGDGDDIVVGDGGVDRLYGEFGADTLDGAAGNDFLYGGSGNDTLTGGDGRDVHLGHAGDDTFFNDDGIAEVVNCGPGTDDPEPTANDTYLACEDV